MHPALEVLSTLIIGQCEPALGRTAEGNRLIDPVLPTILAGDMIGIPPTLPEVIGMTGHASIWVEEWDRAELVLDRLVEATRDASALGRLIYPLAARSHLAFRRGRWQAALADAGDIEIQLYAEAVVE